MPANLLQASASHHHKNDNNNMMQTNNKDDCDLEQSAREHNLATSSSPSSPQSSYNSSYGSNSGKNLINNSHSSLNSSITSSVPGGVVTTQNISTVIKPQANNKSLQFVKIQTPELSKKAVEQIKLAEETKISRSKIKEVEEQEWHNQLLDWKSRRKQHFGSQSGSEQSNLFGESQDQNGGRKVKTFAEMLEQRAKSGNRLGSFHLQRYIGTEEEENPVVRASNVNEDEGQPLSSGSCGDETNDKQDQNSKIRPGDSDYEAHSSTSSGFNQLDSKSPSSPEIGNEQNTRGTKSPMLSSPIIRQSNRSFDVDIKNKETPSRRNDKNEESDNSVFGDDDDEEEEEEEEQKHLQRIAFEAKLKAFERLTIPGAASQTPTKPKPPTRKAPKPPTTAPILQNKPIQHPENSTSFDERQKLNPPVKNLNLKEKQSSLDERLNQSLLCDNRLQTTLNNLAAQSTPPEPSNLVPEVEREFQRVQLSPRQKEQPYKNIPTQASQPQQPLINTNNNNNINFEQLNHKKPYSVPSHLPQVRPDLYAEHSPPIVSKNNSTTTSHLPPVPPPQMTVQKTKSLAPQQSSLPPSPVKNNMAPTPRKPSRDDKDGTVLSVSGKKRCSSCKEELGRGAAAFVVESLSLVYHTNCFRCSVCHANLSNGFRGVDVRVHAGALHCQNCYSRDGLNFSRV